MQKRKHQNKVRGKAPQLRQLQIWALQRPQQSCQLKLQGHQLVLSWTELMMKV